MRITTRTAAGRDAIEACGAECWIGTPDRLATLRGALDGVTIALWLLGSASGEPDVLRALYGPRLELFLTQAIDTTVRGFVYETSASGTPAEIVADGELTVRALTERNAIPVAFLTAVPSDLDAWLADAHGAVSSLLGR